MNRTEIEEYVQRMRDHDWWWDMTDDYSVYERERENANALIAEAVADPDKLTIYNAFQRAANERAPRPTAADFLPPEDLHPILAQDTNGQIRFA